MLKIYDKYYLYLFYIETDSKLCFLLEYHQNMSYVTGINLLLNQVFAMFFKRALSTYRSFFLFFVQTLVPIIFITMGIVTVRKTLFGKDLPNHDISFEKYLEPVTIINGSNKYTESFKKLVGQYSDIEELNKSDLSSYTLDVVSTVFYVI